MEECVAGANVRQKGIPQSLAIARPLDQSRDVHDVQEGRLLAALCMCVRMGT